MVLANGYHDVAAGALATVVTSLEMRTPPARPAPAPAAPGLTLVPLRDRSIAAYRDLFRAVGTDWLWTSRLVMPDGALAAILADPQVLMFELAAAGGGRGLLELDFRIDGVCELAFLGVTRDLIGQGAGRFLMDHAIAMAFARPIRRLWLHTCTFDHPSALAFYGRSGFTMIGRQVEILPDPRLTGHLPRDVAPHVPLIGG